jgi:hypothetical protein
MPAPEGNSTGDARFRTSLTGKLILQVEYEQGRDTALGGPILAWRDATARDLRRTRHMRASRGLEPLI